jgi:hypothetical protein
MSEVTVTGALDALVALAVFILQADEARVNSIPERSEKGHLMWIRPDGSRS